MALVRIEQVYPFPAAEIASEIKRYGDGVRVCWLQEEPPNMGARTFIRPLLADEIGKEIRSISRPESASPATGTHLQHAMEQVALRVEVFGDLDRRRCLILGLGETAVWPAEFPCGTFWSVERPVQFQPAPSEITHDLGDDIAMGADN